MSSEATRNDAAVTTASSERPLTIVQTVASIEQESAGPSYTVPRLAQSLAEAGHHLTVLSLGDPAQGSPSAQFGLGQYCDERIPVDQQLPRPFGKLGRSSAMRRRLLNIDATVLHTHGLWMMPNVYPGEAAQRAGKPLVLAPRGMLGQDALKYSAMAKRLFWLIWQKRAVDAVSCFHATAESEYEDIRAFGLKQPVAVIPNGIDLPEIAHLGDAGNGAPFVLSLGRIHPKKGLDRLIAAFALVADDYPEWRLRIVGPDEDRYASQLLRQIATLGLTDRVSLEPSVVGINKFRLMRQAEVFALSTLHENFGMTVAESLAVETPVISTIGAPWAGLREHRCGWWIGHGPEPMAVALKEAMSLPSEDRHAMGVRGRAWMHREFGWDGIAQNVVRVYSWLIKGGERPSYVRLD